jgi:glycopeptide antibiotics resistance protein
MSQHVLLKRSHLPGVVSSFLLTTAMLFSLATVLAFSVSQALAAFGVSKSGSSLVVNSGGGLVFKVRLCRGDFRTIPS